MPLFSWPVAPFTLETPDVLVLTATAVTAGRAYFSSYVLTAPVTVAQMRCTMSGAPTGNIDMGIYDATGANAAPNNLLGHTGAQLSATGLFTKSLTANLLLSPGQYWLAFVDTVADSVFLRTGVATGLGVLMQTSATNLTVLTATAGTVADTAIKVGVEALLLGGWS